MAAASWRLNAGRIRHRRVQRLQDFRLQPGLLVQADLDIGQQQQFRPRLGVRLEQRSVVAGKSLAQVLLAPAGRPGRNSSQKRAIRSASKTVSARQTA
jgi:hypothetical protein